MLANLLLLGVATIAGTELTRSDSSTPPSDAACRIAAECDHVVVARAVRIVDDAPPAVLRARGRAPLRVAQLVVRESWLGPPETTLHVVVAADATVSDADAVWALEARDAIDLEHWTSSGASAQARPPTVLWQCRSALESPWSVRDVDGRRELDLPLNLAGPILGLTREQLTAEPANARRRVDADLVRADLARVYQGSCELELVGGGTAADGPRRVRIDADGNGVSSDGSTFRWDGARRAQWREAVARARFERLPEVAAVSSGPGSMNGALTIASGCGRRTVRWTGTEPVDATPRAREQVARWNELIRELDGSIPRRR